MRHKYSVIFIAFLFIIISVAGNKISIATKTSELEKIANVLVENKVEIERWNLFTKNTLSVEKSFGEIVKQFVTEKRLYSWDFKEEADVVKAIGTYYNEEKDIKETIQIISTLTNQHPQAYILYDVQGTGWRENWDEIVQDFQHETFDIFREPSTIFTSMSGKIYGKMEGVLHENALSLVKGFQATPIEELKERDFVSVSAHTSDWGELFIPTEDGNMNLQIALRTSGLGSVTNVQVGTPILWTEY